MKHFKKILLTFILFAGIQQAFAQTSCYTFLKPPKELNRGRLKFPGMQYGNPYTMIDRHTYNDPLRSFKSIRAALLDNKNEKLQEMYKYIFSFAITPRPFPGGDYDKGYDTLAAWTKFNSFIFVIGLGVDSGKIKPLDEIDVTGTYRNSFGLKANYALTRLTYLVPYIPTPLDWNPTDLLQFRSRELIYYCEAYDWLKGANNDPDLNGRCPIKPYDQDKNDGTCSPRQRLRIFARNFYVAAEGVLGPIESPTGWKKNHGIMAAAAIGMASIVLNDAGVETNFLKGLFDWVRPSPNYSPVNWYELGHYGARENLLEGKHILGFDDAPQTNTDGTAGFAEGPSYFNYAFSCYIPFLRAEDNIRGKSIPPFYSRAPYNGMFEWAEKIYTGEVMPSYDNSGGSPSSLLGLTGNVGYKYGNVFSGDVYSALYPDYISVLATPYKADEESIVIMPNSGNSCIRASDDGKDSAHFFHFLHETGIAVDKEVGWGESHEDDDFGSFSLYVKKDLQLAIDPTYFGWKDHKKTNQFDMHNTMSLKLGTGEELLDQEFSNVRVTQRQKGLSLKYDNDISTHVSGINKRYLYEIQRSVTTFHLADGSLYYLLNDYAPTGKGIVWRLNGNGVTDNATYTYDAPTRLSSWKNPCSTRNYSLLHYYAALDGVNKPVAYSTVYGESNGITSVNKHNRIVLKQDNSHTIIQSLLIPYSCVKTPPKVTYDEQTDYVATTIESITHDKAILGKRLMAGSSGGTVTDTVRTIHIAQLANLDLIVTDPFKTGAATDTVKSNANEAVISMGSYEHYAAGACSNSFIKFKEAEIANGSYIGMNDTSYISCYFNVNASYRLLSKFKYEGYADLNGLTGFGINVVYYLPDHELGYFMAAKIGNKVLPCTYNDTTGFLTVTIYEPTRFTIELASLCQADCFFPPTSEPIDTIALFNTGTIEVLGHDLDIIQTGGEFTIAKGSKMSICENFVFTNKDSLIMHSIDEDSVYAFQNRMDGSSTMSTDVRERLSSTRSMIIVGNKAALVLDSGSFTHVGDNATILILKGGTLLVRSGAILEIGGKESSNKKMFGEVIAEEGAFVCIEDSSTLYFYADTPTVDTLDANIFYVSLNLANPTVAGTNPLGGRGRFVEPGPGSESSLGFEGIYANSNCIPFCDLKTYMPLYGINNRDFGWCNFSEPVARLQLPDYICHGSKIVLKDFSVLNETSWSLKVYNQSGLFIDEDNSEEPERFKTMELPDLQPGKFYDINLIIKNDCGETDTFQKTISAPDLPVASMVLSGTGCEGSGNISADGSLSSSGYYAIPHLWYVQRLDTLTSLPDDSTMEWAIDTAPGVDSNFNFPGFVWKGGYSYVVGLTVHGYCSDSTITDTIHFPLGVHINVSSKPGSYNNPLGPAALQLNGIVSGATSWSWSPTTYLSNSSILNPVATPTAPITYVLTATSGSCTVRDTLVIGYKNHLAYAGENRTICGGDSIVLGVNYNLPILLGLGYTTHPAQISSLTSLDITALNAYVVEQYNNSLVMGCPTLKPILLDEVFLKTIIQHPAFAPFYARYLQDPTDLSNYNTFATAVSSINQLRQLAMASPGKWACVDDFYNFLYDGFTTCGGYQLYPGISKESALILGALYMVDQSEFTSNFIMTSGAVPLTPAYLDRFLQSIEYSGMFNCYGIGMLLGNPDLQTVYYDEAGFNDYYDSLLRDPSNLHAYSLFLDFLINTGGTCIDHLVNANISYQCIQEFFTMYRAWFNTLNADCYSAKVITWEEKTGSSSWMHLPQWNGYYNVLSYPVEPTDYRMTVVDVATNNVEYDIVQIQTDTALRPLFSVAYQTDSTVFFNNHTGALRPEEVSYLWTFGDGDSSTLVNPEHTFIAFDSSYIVCLYAKNKCGTYQFCDTINVDSASAAIFGSGKKGREDFSNVFNENAQKTITLSYQNILGNNKPNPFNDATLIDYELIPSYKHAQLVITNILGQTVQTLAIHSVKGILQIDRSKLSDGMYYYSLIVDGSTADTKIMVVK